MASGDHHDISVAHSFEGGRLRPIEDGNMDNST
jgi:hypothetical protein